MTPSCRVWKKSKARFTVPDNEGVVLLDAAWTVARAESEQIARAPLAQGNYDVHELVMEVAGSSVHAVRLSKVGAEKA